MKKTILSSVILTAITSTGAHALIMTTDSVILPNTTQTVTEKFASTDAAINQAILDSSTAKTDASNALLEAGNAASAVNGVQHTIDAVKDAVVDEFKNRASADTAIQKQIDVVTATAKTSTDGLTQEIKDRRDADNAFDSELASQKAAQQQIDQAQSQIIGTHDNLISDNTAAIAKEVVDRDAAISQEANARANGDAANRTLITAESTDRQAADTVLQGEVDTESQTRQDADKAIYKELQNRVTNADYQTGQDKQDLEISKVQTTANGAQVTANAATDAVKREVTDRNDADAALAQRIGTKVDQSAFDADQQRQDLAAAAINTKVTNNAAHITDNKTAITTKADQSTVDAINTVVKSNTTTISTISQSVQKNASAIAGNTTNITNNTTNITNNTTDITALQASQKTQDTAISANTSGVADNKTAVATETARATAAEQVNATAIGTKVDQTAFKADQDRQDALLTGKADASVLKTDEQQIARNKSDIATEQRDIASNKSVIASNTKTEASHFTALSAGVKQAQDTGAYAQSRADQAYANADANRRALDHTNQQVAANSKELANHEQRIQDLEANNQTNFNSLKEQQNKDRKEFRAGLAGAFALNSIPAAPVDHTVGFGMGAGTFNGQNAIAAGVTARVATNVSVKSGLSWDSQGNVGAGAGFLVSY